jgi:CspA family cold shock protein
LPAAGNLSWLVYVSLDLCVKTKNEIDSSIRGPIEWTYRQTICVKQLLTFSVLLTIAVFATPALAGRTTGVVKWYNAEKKMGFLTTSDGKEIFVYASAISGSCNGTLREGQAVEFEIIAVPGGK